MFHRRLVIMAIVLSTNQSLAHADGGDQVWRFQGIEDINAMATLPDVDGDGLPEVLVSSYDAGASGDHIYLLSGGSGHPPTVIWSARPQSGLSDGGGWGDYCLDTCPDISGDGFPDALLGTAWGNRSVHAFDGRTGDLLWTFDTTLEFEDGWVYDVSPMPDLNDDGFPEVVCAVGSDNDGGYLLDGLTGSTIWRFGGAADALFLALPLPDLSGDGLPDVLFAAGDNDYRVFAVSGATGSPFWSRDTGASNHTAAVIDDINDDGLPEIVVGNWAATNQVKCLDGATGAPLWQFDNGSYQYAMRLANCGDLDGDGFADLALGSFDRALRTISGVDGTLIWQSWAGTLNGGDFWAIDTVEDLDGDGLREVIGGSFDTKTYLFSGADGDTLWIFNAGKRHYSVRGAPDLSGDGAPDVLAGTQYLSGGGWAYAISGRSDLTSSDNIPQAQGLALQPGGQGPVNLSWDCPEFLEFNLYRVGADARAASRRALQDSHERGELPARELITTLRATAVPNRSPLNDDPLLPQSAGSICRYEYTDTEAPTHSGWHYELWALLPGGETLLLSLSPVDHSPRILESSLFPNPFNPSTEIRFRLAEASRVSLRVLDLQGRIQTEWPSRELPAGRNFVDWHTRGADDRSLPTGIYFVEIDAAGERRYLRAVLLK